jgi:hypothetical protein
MLKNLFLRLSGKKSGNVKTSSTEKPEKTSKEEHDL